MDTAHNDRRHCKKTTAIQLSTSAEVHLFNRVPIGPRFAANRGALPTRLNDIMPNYFCRGAYQDEPDARAEEFIRQKSNCHQNSQSHVNSVFRRKFADGFERTFAIVAHTVSYPKQETRSAESARVCNTFAVTAIEGLLYAGRSISIVQPVWYR